MHKIISTVSIIILVLAGLAWLGSSASQSEAAQKKYSGQNNTSTLAAPETRFDFGSISMKNGNVTKDFTVSNPTQKNIFIPTITTSCMCTKAYIVESDGTEKGPFGMPGMGYVPPANETIRVGESRIIRVIFNPAAHGPAGVGAINRIITLTDADSGELNLEIKALVTP